MPRKTDLADALANVGGSVRKKPEPASVVLSADQKPQTGKVDKSTSSKDYKQPSRLATKPITVHFPKAVRDQLKILAIEQGQTLQDLVAESFNDVFAKYGKPEIAPRE